MKCIGDKDWLLKPKGKEMDFHLDDPGGSDQHVVYISPDARYVLDLHYIGDTRFCELYDYGPLEKRIHPNCPFETIYLEFQSGGSVKGQHFDEEEKEKELSWKSIEDFAKEFNLYRVKPSEVVVGPMLQKEYGITFGCVIKSVEKERVHRCSRDVTGVMANVTSYEVQVFNRDKVQMFGRVFVDTERHDGKFGEEGAERQQNKLEKYTAGYLSANKDTLFLLHGNYHIKCMVHPL